MFRDRWRSSLPAAARNGEPGRDADPEMVRAIVAEVLADRPVPRDGRDADPKRIKADVAQVVAGLMLKNGEPGELGPRGFTGPPGPMPRHQWDGTKLRFEQDDGEWGKWVDLQGERGLAGFGGGVIQVGGSGTGNSWFPAGW